MRLSSTLSIVAVLVLVISMLCIWFYPSAQGFMTSNTIWTGTKDFASEFSADNIDSLDDLPDMPEKTILVTVPYLEYSDEELSKVKRFVDDGGMLLLMDDYGYGNSILEYLGVSVRFSNKPLLDPVYYYKNQLMPRIIDLAPELRENDINMIMLNHATTLTNVIESEAIARSSSASFLDVNEDMQWNKGEPEGPFAVVGEFRLGKGTLNLIADPSIMINTMIGRDDNFNFIRYLTQRKGEQDRILVDISHLSKTPIDISKTRLSNTRRFLSNPYALLGITVAIIIVVSRYTLKKERENG